MTAVVYPALVTGSREGGYTARFPDFENVSAQAPTQAELMSAARDALHRRLERMTADGVDWPEPSEISALGGHPEAAGAGALLVDVDIEDAPVRVNISVGERLLKRIDQAAEVRGMTRSGFIAAASRQALGEGPFTWDSKKVEETLADYGRKLNDKFGPESDFYRGVSEMERKITRTAEAFAMQVADAFRSRPQSPPPERKPADEPPTPSSAE